MAVGALRKINTRCDFECVKERALRVNEIDRSHAKYKICECKKSGETT